MEHSATFVVNAIQWLKLGLELVSAVVVAAGAGVAIARLVGGLRSRGATSFTAVRLDFARALALALEFQLASDILGTTISPGWQELTELAVIAAIRTALNFFLAREIKEEAAERAAEEAAAIEPAPGAA